MPTDTAQSLTSIIQHVMDTHHVYLRSELPFLEERIAKMCANHGKDRPELFTIQQLLHNLKDDLLDHLAKEEQILFPYATALEAALEKGTPLPHACFPTVQAPIRVMHMEHDAAQDLLQQLRATTANYADPGCYCENGTEFYRRLAALDADLHEHIRVENDVLFPRAVQLEESVR